MRGFFLRKQRKGFDKPEEMKYNGKAVKSLACHGKDIASV